MYEVCLKSIKNETLFSKKGMNNEWNINFLQNSPLGIQHTHFSEFSIGQNVFQTTFFIACEVGWTYSFNIFHVLKFLL